MGQVVSDKTGAQRLASAFLWITERFISPRSLGADSDELRRLRTLVTFLLLVAILVSITIIDHFANARWVQGGWGASLVVASLSLLVVTRSTTIRAVWVGHLFSATVYGSVVVVVLAHAEPLSGPTVALLTFPCMMMLIVGGRGAWVWCGMSVLIAALWTVRSSAPQTEEWMLVRALATIGLTGVGHVCELSRERALDDLAEARDRAEAAAEAKSRFLANMSHEIRTPMNGVLGMLGILLETRLARDQRGYAETAHASGVALLDLLNDILDFSKIEAGQMELETAQFDLCALVEDVLDQVAVLGDDKGIELVSRYVPGTPTLVQGDRGRIRQILLNLVSNALKFTEDGHVLVTIEQTRRSDGRSWFRCSVRDTGVGVPVTQHDKIFEDFQQVDMSTTRKFEGTGLGLAIVRDLVRLMDGVLGMDSQEGRGSTFWFKLPLRPVEPMESHSVPDELRGLRVLVVDDHRISREALHERLVDWDLRVQARASGSRALRELKEAAARGLPYQLAVLDCHMPQMGGLELAQAIKADSAIRDTVLIMLSAVSDRSTSQQMRAAGCAAYLTKPVHQSALMSALMVAWQTRGQDVVQPYGPRSISQEWSEAAPEASLGLRVLVVEDNVTNQKVALRMLTALGCTVDVATNGREAVERVEASIYDLVLMDVQMEQMDGLEATKEIRRREAGTSRHLPIVAVTAHAMPTDRQRCLEAGMDDYLTKPVRRRALLRVLRPLAAKVSAERESTEADEAAGSIADDSAAEGAAKGATEPVVSSRAREV
ncbi:MAG: response regulator [Myxococcota bacterium]